MEECEKLFKGVMVEAEEVPQAMVDVNSILKQ